MLDEGAAHLSSDEKLHLKSLRDTLLLCIHLLIG
jgi:hypothetical protein